MTHYIWLLRAVMPHYDVYTKMHILFTLVMMSIQKHTEKIIITFKKPNRTWKSLFSPETMEMCVWHSICLISRYVNIWTFALKKSKLLQFVYKNISSR